MKKFILKPCAIKTRRIHYNEIHWSYFINIKTVRALIDFECIFYKNNRWYINSLNITGNNVVIFSDLYEVTGMTDKEIEELQQKLRNQKGISL